MTFIFPTNPFYGQTYGVANNSWVYDGFGWQKIEAGISGGSGTQGIQGLQGIQGIQGPAGGGGSGIQGLQGTQGTQGIQGESGIGTQGIQGSQGIAGSGVQGSQGIQGSKGDFATGSPYTGITKQASFTTGTEGLARKLAFLTPDGSVTYDFIRNYDVFNPADLQFGIRTFTSTITTSSLMGSTAFGLNGFSISAAYNPVGVPTVSGATLSTSSSYAFGFPITISSPYTSYSFLSTQGITYAPTAPQSTTITLTATDGSTTSTSNITVTFLNNVYYGVNSDSSLSGTNIPSSLTAVLSNTRNRSFSVTAGAGEYIYYAFPQRLNTSAIAFVVGGFEGGFEDERIETVTNSKGFSESFSIYRSTNQNLGSTTVTVQNG